MAAETAIPSSAAPVQLRGKSSAPRSLRYRLRAEYGRAQHHRDGRVIPTSSETPASGTGAVGKPTGKAGQRNSDRKVKPSRSLAELVLT